jgi:hypothetical protein
MNVACAAEARGRCLWEGDAANQPSTAPPQAPCLPLKGSVRLEPPLGLKYCRLHLQLLIWREVLPRRFGCLLGHRSSWALVSSISR